MFNVVFWFDGDHLAGAVVAHADAVDGLGGLHGSAIVGDDDELALEAIDAGADDVNIENSCVEVYTSPEALEAVRVALEAKNITVASAEHSMVPRTTVELDEKSALQILKMLDKLDEIDEVQQVSSNADFSDAVLEKYQS